MQFLRNTEYLDELIELMTLAELNQLVEDLHIRRKSD